MAVEEITFWENIALSKWGSYIAEIEKDAVLQASRMLKKPTTALDIGCEGGRWSQLLVDSGWQVICTDINPETLAICRERLPTAECILTSPDATRLPLATASVDLVLCIEVSAVVDADWFADEVRRALRPEGLLVADVTNSQSARGVVYRLLSLFDARRRSYAYTPYKFNYGQRRRGLIKRGFSLEYELGFCWFPFSRASNSSLVPGFTRLEKRLGLGRLITLSPWIVFIARKI